MFNQKIVIMQRKLLKINQNITLFYLESDKGVILRAFLSNIKYPVRIKTSIPSTFTGSLIGSLHWYKEIKLLIVKFLENEEVLLQLTLEFLENYEKVQVNREREKVLDVTPEEVKWCNSMGYYLQN